MSLIPARHDFAPAAGPGITPRVAAGEIYDHHAAGLYRQALLVLDDADLAEQVVVDVIVGECERPQGPGAEAGSLGYRLAVSAYRRCLDLIGPPARRPRAQPPAGRAADTLSVTEREALALVLFGGLGYRQASHVLAVSPRELAVVLHRALHRLAGGPGTPAGHART